MNSRELILLSPYRLPALNQLMLGNDETASILNALAAFWHPAALKGASGPPRIGSPYDYEQPAIGHIYAVPEAPPLVQPDDWHQRVKDAGAIMFRATADRTTTLTNLKEALREAGTDSTGLLDLPPEKTRPFHAIGFGHVMIEALFGAMEHENVLATTDLWLDVQQAVAGLDDADQAVFRRHLQSAADRLLSAREVLYPVTLHLVDICLASEHTTASTLPYAFHAGTPINVIASGSVLEAIQRDQPVTLAGLREAARNDLVEVCGGQYLEHEDALLSVDSQLWNLRKGLAISKELLDQDIRVFARGRFGASPHLPLFLNSVGIRRAVLLSLDESVVPTYRVPVINWPSPDGKQIDAFTRAPFQAESPQTFFHWAHYLQKTISQDHSATVALLHRSSPAFSSYEDLIELSRFGPIFGQWTTLTRYMNEVLAGEYASAGSPDDFHGDFLTERNSAHVENPIGWFASRARNRRRIETAWTLAGVARGLLGSQGKLPGNELLEEVEVEFEKTGQLPEAAISPIEKSICDALAGKLLSRATGNSPGYMLFNPCSFARRVALEIAAGNIPLPVAGPIKAFQADAGKAQLVVEIPALGFAWIPRNGPPGTQPQASRMKLADEKHVRNEFFEAEIDPATGGLRGLRDHRIRVNRIGQQLIFNPGSTMQATKVTVVSNGPALGELLSEGELVDAHGQILAQFRQRYRAWLGRPILELRIEIMPRHATTGYPWHAFYGARFAWRDERAMLLRGTNGTGYVTSHTRPETPDYLEIRAGKQSTAIFTGGLPFHQRFGVRMVDVILATEGETTQSFDLGLSIDRDYPMLTAQGMITPPTIIPTSNGPPHVGAAGWLFHLDAPNVLLTSMRPAENNADAVIARFLECGSHSTHAEFRCAREPKRALLVDSLGDSLTEVSTTGDAAMLEIPAGDLVQLRLEF